MTTDTERNLNSAVGWVWAGSSGCIAFGILALGGGAWWWMHSAASCISAYLALDGMHTLFSGIAEMRGKIAEYERLIEDQTDRAAILQAIIDNRFKTVCFAQRR